VQLTAATRAARVRLAAYGAQGRRLGGITLRVPPAATRAWSPPGGAGYVVVTPHRGGSGGGPDRPVSGAVSYAGDGLAAVPLTAFPLRVERPPTRPTLR
jgi:hypothetical protein